uniref:Uncharacterized protein n=1 Tax=Arundo donax TaxID=35708 RepID=A0A0A8YSX3_ARUDO
MEEVTESSMKREKRSTVQVSLLPKRIERK